MNAPAPRRVMASPDLPDKRQDLPVDEEVHHERAQEDEHQHQGPGGRSEEAPGGVQGLGPLIPRALASNGVQVVIGGEHSRDEMREYSVVLSRYGITGEVVGVLGVIGPTRMAYPRTISTVRYISTVMSDLLGDLYGSEGNR